MLMSHTSSIADDWSYLDTLTSTPEPALPLEELVRNCLTPERRAEWKQSFLDARPGSVAAYSNTGVSLLAWVVESITGLPFEVFSARVVQGPLQVAHGAWFEQALPEGEVLARPYGFDRSAIEPFRVPTWPAGSYLSSARGFAPVASVFINRGSVGGAQIVRPSTLASMEELVRGPYGLCLEQLVAHTSEPGLRGHYGDIPGFHSGFLYQPTERVGAFYFAAGEFDHTLLRAEVESALLEAAREFEF
jgi:CubicO group peptidase (beta-lactamase class C family)